MEMVNYRYEKVKIADLGTDAKNGSNLGFLRSVSGF